MIYFIQSGNGGPIKIGFTESDVQARFSQLQTGSPYPLTLLGVIHGDQNAEKALHEKFKAHHIRNEWFEPHKEILRYVAMADPLEEAKINPDFVFDLKKQMKMVEAEYIRKALEFCGGNRAKAAKLLNLTRPTLHSKLKALGLDNIGREQNTEADGSETTRMNKSVADKNE